MRVSVIVPVFNGEKTLPSLFHALMAQTYPTELTEILCVDNNSSDGTAQVIKQWAKQGVRYLRCSRQSSYAARNVGIAQAQGDILAFIDADCQPTANWLTAGVQQMSRNNVDRLAGSVHIPITEPVSVWALLDASYYADQKSQAEQGWAGTGNLLVRNTVVDQVGLFDETLMSVGDAEFGRRCTDAGIPIVYGPEAIVSHPPCTQARQLIRRNWRIGLGQTLTASNRTPVVLRRSWRNQRQLFEQRLGYLSLNFWRQFQLQVLKYGIVDLVRHAGYLWGRWVLQQRRVEATLLCTIRREHS